MTIDNKATSEIQTRAYQIWEQEGRPDGRDIDHWLRAESELSAPSCGRRTKPGTTAAKRPAQRAKKTTK